MSPSAQTYHHSLRVPAVFRSTEGRRCFQGGSLECESPCLLRCLSFPFRTTRTPVSQASNRRRWPLDFFTTGLCELDGKCSLIRKPRIFWDLYQAASDRRECEPSQDGKMFYEIFMQGGGYGPGGPMGMNGMPGMFPPGMPGMPGPDGMMGGGYRNPPLYSDLLFRFSWKVSRPRRSDSRNATRIRHVSTGS